ncbi:hypothetical protein AYO27_13400 [Rhizobium sp. GHKF11]|nr:hypothetical protein AYO27_13400 [Rhizobium sp. GHKF11]
MAAEDAVALDAIDMQAGWSQGVMALIRDLRAIFYLGIALLICGGLIFFGGLVYLFWLVITQPNLI